MILYHGTWEDCLGKILNTKMISNSCYPNEDTAYINNAITNCLGYNLRNHSLYLSSDIKTANTYDYTFKIDTQQLNKNMLYIGNNKIIQNIFLELLKGNINEAEKLIIQYEKSFMQYNKMPKLNLEDLEFLYFDKIFITQNDLI